MEGECPQGSARARGALGQGARASQGMRAHFTSHSGKEHGPSYDRSTLESLAVLIRPAPEKNLSAVKLELTPEIEQLLSPADAAERPAPTAPAGPRPRGEVLGREPRPGLPPLRPKIIIGTSEIVDHGILAGLMKAGRCVARIVTDGVEKLAGLHPDEREARWQEAEANHEIKRFKGGGYCYYKSITKRVASVAPKNLQLV